MGGLPEEFAVGFAKCHEIPAVAGEFRVVECFVICSDENFSTDNEWPPAPPLRSFVNRVLRSI